MYNYNMVFHPLGSLNDLYTIKQSPINIVSGLVQFIIIKHLKELAEYSGVLLVISYKQFSDWGGNESWQYNVCWDRQQHPGLSLELYLLYWAYYVTIIITRPNEFVQVHCALL